MELKLDITITTDDVDKSTLARQIRANELSIALSKK